MSRLSTNLNVVNALARSARNRASELNSAATLAPVGINARQQDIYDAYAQLVEAVNDLEHYLYPGGRDE